MRVLILSWYFPPINEIGAVRVGKLADYLHEKGHEVWVITARREAADKSLMFTLPPERVIRTNWIDIDHLSTPWKWSDSSLTSEPEMAASTERVVTAAAPKPAETLRSRLGRHYMWMARFPDRQGGWLPYLGRAANRLLREMPFDLIYASAPPFATLIGAARLSRRFGVPWVAEYRDAWSRNHYTPKPEWREHVDRFLEDRVTRSAAGIVSVTEPWAEYYKERFHKPSIAVYNGFDPNQQNAPPSSGKPGLPLTIVHMGTIYWGLRDPSLLFEAIKITGLTPDDIEVSFYGALPSAVFPLVEKYGVRDFVKVPARVPYQRALEIQGTSDILLLLQSPGDAANVPAKTFEYFAARRPILGLGLDEGIPARLVRERNAGLYVSDANTIANQLKEWVARKRRDGTIPPLPESVSAGLSRNEQFRRLDGFFDTLPRKAARAAHIVWQEPLPIPNGMLPSDRNASVDFSSVEKPQLLFIIDAEEEFDWSRPFSANSASVTTMQRQHLAHEIFARYGVVPTYAVDYVVADWEEGYKPLLDFLRDGACEIGAQLHPWVTPPQVEELGERNSFPGNLPADLEYAKLKNLTDRIVANLGVRPWLYRAGRYGTGVNTAQILRRLGYTMDCSVLPHARRLSPHASDYTGAPVSPYWIGGGVELLELPVTSCTIGWAHRTRAQLAPYLFSPTGLFLRLPGVMARLKLLEQIRLSPEGTTLPEAKRLTRFLLSQQQKVFVVSYHTPSLGVGHTPYVRSAADLAAFLAWIEGYLEFFLGEIGGVTSTPRKIRELALAASVRRQFFGGEATSGSHADAQAM